MTETNLNKTIGKNIRKYRLLYNLNNDILTQKELAQRVGICTSLIGGLESNNVNQGLSIYTLYKISKVLKVPIDKFFE